jgi:hypothetical protein
MKLERFATRLAYSLIGALTLVGPGPSLALAQQHDLHPSMSELHERNGDHKQQMNALVATVRDATERFRDVSLAEAEGYGLLFGCVSGPDLGAMGLHFVNLSLVGDDVLDPARPEIVIYEPTRVRLIGADFLVLKDVWDAKHAAPPQLMGQLLHLFESPNRFGLPAFYTLHVWAWKENPNGTFVNWHPKVSCDGFADRQ